MVFGNSSDKAEIAFLRREIGRLVASGGTPIEQESAFTDVVAEVRETGRSPKAAKIYHDLTGESIAESIAAVAFIAERIGR